MIVMLKAKFIHLFIFKHVSQAPNNTKALLINKMTNNTSIVKTIWQDRQRCSSQITLPNIIESDMMESNRLMMEMQAVLVSCSLESNFVDVQLICHRKPLYVSKVSQFQPHSLDLSYHISLLLCLRNIIRIHLVR